MGGEFSVTCKEQRRQLEALKTLDGALGVASAAAVGEFAGLSIRLYHPDSCPSDTFSFVDDRGDFRIRSGPMAVRPYILSFPPEELTSLV